MDENKISVILLYFYLSRIDRMVKSVTVVGGEGLKIKGINDVSIKGKKHFSGKAQFDERLR